MQWLKFERLRWEKGKPESARYHCAASQSRATCSHDSQPTGE